MTPLQEWLLHHMPQTSGYNHDADLREEISAQLAAALAPKLQLALLSLDSALDAIWEADSRIETEQHIRVAIQTLEDITGEDSTPEENPQ